MYEALIAELADILKVDVAFVAVFDDVGQTHMRSLAAWLDGRLLRNFRYALSGTPCAQVVGRDFRYVEKGVRAEFAPDTIFAAKAMDCYAAYPLFAVAGESLGLLVTMNRTAMVDPVLAESMLKIFAVRISAEIERERGEVALRRAAVAVSSADGVGIYRELVRVLATVLGVEIAYIVVAESTHCSALKTIAFYKDGDLIDEFEYRIAGTPCEHVLQSEQCVIIDRLHDRFPEDEMSKGMEAGGYAGLPIKGSDGNTLGIIAVASRKPLLNADLVESMLKIFAARVRTEFERSRAEASLRSSEEQYRAIFDASADALVLWNSTPRRVDVNPAYERIHGFTREEVLRGDYRAGMPAEYAERRRELVQRTLAGMPCTVELETVRKDGERIDVEVRTIPVHYRGEPHVLAVIRDVTERKRTESALRASAAQYRAMFDAWEDALVLRDANFRIVDVNTTYEKFTGRKREEVLGIDRVIANPPGVDERVKALHGRALAGESIQLETELLNIDGTRRDLELRGVPMRHQGKPHVLYIGRDISARKRAEAERAVLENQLRQSQKMEAIGQLTGGIAHDFNNILQGVIGYVVLAQECHQESDDPRIGRYLDRAHAAADRAGNLIKQMLTFSRGQRGERLPLSPMPLVEEATQMLRSTLPSTIELRVLADKDVPAILVDPIQFEQVLLNLSINARDAMNNEGDIEVVTRIAEVQGAVCASCRQRVNGFFVELAVRDSGPGIPSHIMERMFEPFFTSKEVGKGSGMGLAMVHGIVHDHGGHVLVDSALGKGAAIRVMFPRAEADSMSPRGRSAMGLVASRSAVLDGRVLVAEDDIDVRELLFDLLTSWGIEVTPALNGGEALTIFEADAQRFDLLLTDLTMPGMNGVALARAVTRRRPGMPVLLCTAFSDDFRDDEINDAGVQHVLRKPIDPADLHACLARLLSRTAAQRNERSPPLMQ